MHSLWSCDQVEADLRATQAGDVFNRESAPRQDEIASIYSHLTPEEVDKIRKQKAAARRRENRRKRLERNEKARILAEIIFNENKKNK